MSDLIDRQAAIDAVHKVMLEFFDLCDDDEERPITEKEKAFLKINKKIANSIKALQSAQPEIIRCKDCKHGRPYKHTTAYVECKVDGDPIDRDSDFFCRYGERRE